MRKKYYNKIIESIDNTYRKFTSTLIPSSKKEILGVRIPILRNIAKEIVDNQDELNEYLEINLNDCVYFEEIMLYILVITRLKKEWIEIKKYIDKILPYLDNWSTVDTLATNLKITKKYKEVVFDYLLSKISVDSIYENRFIIVMFLSYYLEDHYLDKVLDLVDIIMKKDIADDYYLGMSIAWLLSVAYIKYDNRILQFLRTKVNHTLIINKTISKVNDSHRVNNQNKDKIKKLKTKK